MTGWIDVHTHLGDVCYPWSGTNKKEALVEIQPSSLLENWGYPNWMTRMVGSSLFPKQSILNFCKTAARHATVDHLLDSMQASGIAKSWVLSVAPAVTAADLKDALQKRSMLMPFMSIDFTSKVGVLDQVGGHLQSYPYKGVKFHPNLQNVDPHSEEALDLYKAAGKYGLLLMMHVGRTPFLDEPARSRARLQDVVDLPLKFPDTKFVFCHMGNYFDENWVDWGKLKEADNIWADTAGVSVEAIVQGLRFLGHKRVLFGSDWPYGSHQKSLGLVKKAVEVYCLESSVDVEEALDSVLKSNAERLTLSSTELATKGSPR